MEVRSKGIWGMAKLKIKYSFHTVCKTGGYYIGRRYAAKPPSCTLLVAPFYVVIQIFRVLFIDLIIFFYFLQP